MLHEFPINLANVEQRRQKKGFSLTQNKSSINSQQKIMLYKMDSKLFINLCYVYFNNILSISDLSINDVTVVLKTSYRSAFYCDVTFILTPHDSLY